jgi:hypothetical protein
LKRRICDVEDVESGEVALFVGVIEVGAVGVVRQPLLERRKASPIRSARSVRASSSVMEGPGGGAGMIARGGPSAGCSALLRTPSAQPGATRTATDSPTSPRTVNGRIGILGLARRGAVG